MELGLEYAIHGQYVRNLRSGLLRKLRLARVPIGLAGVHRVEYVAGERLDERLIDLLRLKAEEAFGVSRRPEQWYVAPNRNRLLCWGDQKISIQVGPRSRSLRVLVRRSGLLFGEVVDEVSYALTFGFWGDTQSARHVAESLSDRSRHRVFPWGTISPNKIDFYKSTVGLTIRADGSHPGCLEITENDPGWVRDLIMSNLDVAKSLREYAREIRTHVAVMKSIGESAQELAGAAHLLRKGSEQFASERKKAEHA